LPGSFGNPKWRGKYGAEVAFWRFVYPMLGNGYEWWFRNAKREWKAAFFREFLKEKVSLNEGVAEF
jgi:hypothetical protein